MIPNRQDRRLALVLAALTALSRIPFVANRLWEWDSVLYARALEQGFHVDEVLPGMRPHPPGYIFYVASAGIGRAIGLDSDHALVAVSIVASGLGVAACYLLCRRFAGTSLALALAAAFASAPLVWVHGEVAMPYIVLAPLSAALALAFRDAREDPRRVLPASLAFGALAGFRQDLLLFLFPLWLWSVRPADVRTRVRGAWGLAGGCLLWFVPSALLSDGPVAYVTRSLHQLTGASGVSGNAERSTLLNVVLVGDSLFWAGLVLTVAVLVIGLSRALAAVRGQRLPDDGEFGFFAIWLLPALLFYCFVHIGEWGFVLSIVPGIYVLLAWLLGPLSPPRRTVAAMAVAANAALGVALFLAGDHPVFSRVSLVAHDRATDEKTAWIRDNASEDTIVLAAAEVLVVSYYLPDRAVRYSNNAAPTTYDVPIDRPTTLVIYEPAARPRLPIAQTVSLAGGDHLDLASVSSGTLRLGGADIGDTRR